MWCNVVRHIKAPFHYGKERNDDKIIILLGIGLCISAGAEQTEICTAMANFILLNIMCLI